MYHGSGSDKGPVVGRPEILVERRHLSDAWDAADAAFPVRVTRSWWDRMTADVDDPLARQALPDRRELDADPGDRVDPVGDEACSPVPWVVHKYPNRVLLLVTKRCHLYCRYCFRRNHVPSDRQDPSDEEWQAALAYVESSGAQEVILSGGDPLAIRDDKLFATIDRLRLRVPTVRIHTRAPITRPDRVTPGLVNGLSKRQPVWVIVHVNHPQELSPEVDQALARLVDAGIPVLNQSVLLRGVNDDSEVLATLFTALVSRRVFPYYLHHPDHAVGNAHFRVGLDEGRQIVADLRRRVSGLAMPRYVLDEPEGTGKRDILPRRPQ
jgi:lysine 2,3-aminomutase